MDKPAIQEIMDFSSFSRFIQGAPKALVFLLNCLGIDGTSSVLGEVYQLYGRLTDLDFLTMRRDGELSANRLDDLAQLSGLPIGQALLYFELYRTYLVHRDKLLAGNAYNDCPYTEEELIFFLTGGRFPLNYSFLLEGNELIYRYLPGLGQFSPVIDGCRQVHNACIQYLRDHGLVFFSEKEVLEIARREQWPNWEIAFQRFVREQEGK